MSSDFVDASAKADVTTSILKQMIEDAVDQTKAIEVRKRRKKGELLAQDKELERGRERGEKWPGCAVPRCLPAFSLQTHFLVAHSLDSWIPYKERHL